jgi:hypothetical protein
VIGLDFCFKMIAWIKDYSVENKMK